MKNIFSEVLNQPYFDNGAVVNCNISDEECELQITMPDSKILLQISNKIVSVEDKVNAYHKLQVIKNAIDKLLFEIAKKL